MSSWPVFLCRPCIKINPQFRYSCTAVHHHSVMLEFVMNFFFPLPYPLFLNVSHVLQFVHFPDLWTLCIQLWVLRVGGRVIVIATATVTREQEIKFFRRRKSKSHIPYSYCITSCVCIAFWSIEASVSREIGISASSAVGFLPVWQLSISAKCRNSREVLAILFKLTLVSWIIVSVFGYFLHNQSTKCYLL